MIYVYENGKEFLAENETYLNQNKYMSALFFLDAGILNEPNKKNYAIKVEAEGKKLLGIKIEPYNLLLYGDEYCLEELLDYLYQNGYDFPGVMCPTTIGARLCEISDKVIGIPFALSIGMDFMEARTFTEPSASEVIPAEASDIDEILNCQKRFFQDCGLNDEPNKEHLEKKLDHFRLIKEDGCIVAMAAFTQDTDASLRVTYVYTDPQHRGKGYGRKVVNAVKNEILNAGKIATLNVDQANPISNHLYASLGFKKVFSQGIYLKAK